MISRTDAKVIVKSDFIYCCCYDKINPSVLQHQGHDKPSERPVNLLLRAKPLIQNTVN